MNDKYPQYTIEEIRLNVEKMNAGDMHEVDQLTMMCDTQRSLIRILQQEIGNSKR